MSWNPHSGIGYFEPGCIVCAHCGLSDPDCWNDAPEGFDYYEYGALGGQWECEECQAEQEVSQNDIRPDRAKVPPEPADK